MANEFSRNISDAKFVSIKPLPAAGVQSNHDVFDIGGSYNQPGNVEIDVSWPAMTALADTKKLNFWIYDSADNQTFPTGWTNLALGSSPVGGLAVPTGPGAGQGVLAGAVRFRLPSNCRRYVMIRQEVEAAGGGLTAFNCTARFTF